MGNKFSCGRSTSTSTTGTTTSTTAWEDNIVEVNDDNDFRNKEAVLRGRYIVDGNDDKDYDDNDFRNKEAVLRRRYIVEGNDDKDYDDKDYDDKGFRNKEALLMITMRTIKVGADDRNDDSIVWALMIVTVIAINRRASRQ